MIDDFQIDNETVFDKEPTEMGLIFGADYLLDRYDLLFNAEYLRVNPWTYNQPKSWNKFVFRNQPLGFDEIDVDIMKMSTTYFLGKNYANLTMQYKRKGVGSIYDEWTSPWIDNDYEFEFPSGKVEKDFSISTELFYNWKFLTGKLNIANILSTNDEDLKILSEISFKF